MRRHGVGARVGRYGARERSGVDHGQARAFIFGTHPILTGLNKRTRKEALLPRRASPGTLRAFHARTLAGSGKSAVNIRVDLTVRSRVLGDLQRSHKRRAG